jgi:hypothetical protein
MHPLPLQEHLQLHALTLIQPVHKLQLCQQKNLTRQIRNAPIVTFIRGMQVATVMVRVCLTAHKHGVP